MKYINRRGESLAGIIVGVTIIATVIVSIANIISLQYQIEDDYQQEQNIFILQNNANNIAKKLDTSVLGENETFSLYKDTTNQEFLIMTGANVNAYKYIDPQGNNIANITSYQYPYFSRLMYLEKIDISMIQYQKVNTDIQGFNGTL